MINQRVLFWLGFVTISTVAQATTLFVANPSFETLPAGGLNHPNVDGPFSVGAIPGWSETDATSSGQYQPDTNAFTVQDDGPTVAYSNSGIIFQDVTTVAAGVTYTMTVDIGNRLDTGHPASADLLVNGVTYDAIGTVAAPGQWATFTATYTALPADFGDTITIQLVATGAQGDFDNVTMSSTAPEPASAGLLAICLVGMVLYKRSLRHRSC
jgi:hypothetical protein